ncbi:hypothetical protein [Paeniglutamicibacter gangotriensis]|uniref:hypothetical protein n=1 Tax=Paeniglutamicibacter gangotriensis TaxID=254787 RepID=UPI0038995D5E
MSSGNETRYRLNLHGDRQLNKAKHAIARSRMAFDAATNDYGGPPRARPFGISDVASSKSSHANCQATENPLDLSHGRVSDVLGAFRSRWQHPDHHMIGGVNRAGTDRPATPFLPQGVRWRGY